MATEIQCAPDARVSFDNLKYGDNVRVYSFVNIYGDVVLGDDVSIACFVQIEGPVTIGSRVKVQPFVVIPAGTMIGNDVFVGPHVCFTNDRHPASSVDGRLKTNDDWVRETTVVEDGVSIGAGCTIWPGITIGKNSVIAAGTVVTKNVPQYTLLMQRDSLLFLNALKSGAIQ